MDFAEAFAQERRARLAAERLLNQKQTELFEANRKLSQHARALSFEIIEKREEVEEVREEKTRVLGDLAVAERRLWAALTTVKDGFALFDSANRLIAANPAWLRPFDGVDAVAPGASYDDILQVAAEEGVIDIGNERRSVWTARMRDRWRQENLEPLVIRLWNGAWIRLLDRRGAEGDVVCLALDISATMRNEARLKEARRKAEAANRAKSAFLANMSHELRTPMNGVVGMAQLLEETTLDGEQKSCVETIRSSAEALLVIINDVLDFSKLEADRMQIHAEDFDLEEVIHEIVHLLQPQVQGKGIRLMVDYDMFLPTRFHGDRGRLRQIITNLMGNAVKFTLKGHVLVRVTGVEPEDGPHQVHVSVEDTGIGIPDDHLAHIFDEFTQVDDERNRKFEGTGLGLAISKKLVQRMGGDIWVDSELGRGSVFGFQIPMTAVAPVESPPGHLAGKTAVLVDDDAAEAGVLTGQLRSLGLRVKLLPAVDAALIPDETSVVFVTEDEDCAASQQLAAALGGRVPVVALADGRCAPAPGLAGLLSRPVRRAALCGLLEKIHPDSAAPAPAPLKGPLRQMKVLAAEDNKTNQLVLSKMLKSLDIELHFANNGREAVDLWHSWQPDMMFMDISMPEMDGKEATRRIRTAEEGSGRRTPIVALTAHALSGDDAEILAAGLDHYLTKPLKKAEIVDRIRAETPAGCRPVDAPAEAPAPSPAQTIISEAMAVEAPAPVTPEPIGFTSRRGRATVGG